MAGHKVPFLSCVRNHSWRGWRGCPGKASGKVESWRLFSGWKTAERFSGVGLKSSMGPNPSYGLCAELLVSDVYRDG